MRKSVFMYSTELENFSYPADCPFNAQRAGLTRELAESFGLLDGSGTREVAPIAASRSELEAFHLPAYLDALRAAGEGKSDATGFAMGIGTPDCPVFRGMYDYVALASGASIHGAHLLLSGEADVVFNPSGGLHHAGPAKAAGFCFVNDVVLAALSLTGAGKRVLVLDLDAHHCDGVQNAFYARRDVMTISLHESGNTLFPGTGFEDEIGIGEGKGYTVNVPLPVGTYDAAYFRAFTEIAMPLMKSFKPDVIILELGMDALAGDPLAHLNLTNNVYVDIVNMVLSLGKPILATGGGGYHVENTVRAWCLLWSVLCGHSAEDMSIGMGGVMLENREWLGGLRDRVLIPDARLRDKVDAEIGATILKIKSAFGLVS